MIKKLKIKFILISLILITIVISVCFSALYVVAKRNIEKESIEALETFVIINDKPAQKQDQLNKPSENKYDKKPEFLRPEDVIINKSLNLSAFCVKTDDSGNLLSVYGYKENLTNENKIVLEKITKKVLDKTLKKGAHGILEEENLRYYVTDTVRDNYISFMDMGREREAVITFVKGFYIVLIITWAVALIISIILAEISIRPVEKEWMRQKQFIADASHELKTPLTVILASTELMLGGDNVTKEQIKLLECTKTESERMKELVSGMLYLARSDDETEKAKEIKKTTFSLSDVLNETLLNFEITCFEKNKLLDYDIDDNIFIKGDETEIRQLVDILLDNACKYSNENGKITVELKKQQGSNKCVFSVRNTGEPISERDIPHLFERFYRASSSRAREEGGYGLGLSIGKAIANNHNTEIQISSDKNETVFFIKFSVL